MARLLVVLAAALALVPGTARAAGCGGAAGSFAFVRGDTLQLLDFDSCSERTLVSRGAAPPVRFSPDGRFVAFGRGEVVPVGGGPILRPLGSRTESWQRSWSWGYSGLIAGITHSGGVLVASVEDPSYEPHLLVPDGFGARTIAFGPSGEFLAVSRPLSPFGAGRAEQEIWVVTLATGARRRLLHVPRRELGPPEVLGWSPDSRYVLFWLDAQNSASLEADGFPLEAIPARGGRPRAVVPFILGYDDYRTWCGSTLVVAAGGDRVSTHGKSIVAATPPRWMRRDLSRDRPRSWISPACSPDGAWVAAAAGPDTGLNESFVRPWRSIWLLAADGSTRRRLTEPPRGMTDESPRWSRDGHSVLFVRTRSKTPFRGSLYLVRLDGSLAGPIAQLGTSPPYYGDYGWAVGTDWFQPRVG